MSTCVSLNCPFYNYCRHYNFLVERGEKCEIMEDIIRKALKYNSNTSVIDTSEIIRCKDCKYRMTEECAYITYDQYGDIVDLVEDENYCCFGKRKGE